MVAEPLNKDCFRPPKRAAQERIARGFTEHGQNGGMSQVQQVHLSPGQTYYRFCDAARFAKDPAGAASGGWWIDYEVFLRIRNAARDSATMRDYAARHGQAGLSYAAKLYLAVPYEWGDCGAIVVAQLKTRLDAFRGRGLTAYLDGTDPRDGGAKYSPMQDATISQLYIPELRSHFATAFTIVEKGPATAFV